MSEHPNVAILKRFDPENLSGSADVIAEDIVFHYFNPRLPDIQGDYVGLNGLKKFFARIAAATNGSFIVTPVSVNAVGDELLVVHSKNSMTLADERIETDVALVWRIVDGRIAEVWDIPSVHTGCTSSV
ncbi:MAG: nuclear transport factor 2 family protein [Methyloligellaceae bacterium]